MLQSGLVSHRVEADPSTLAIAGLARLSTCDWPGRLVATVFFQGCPWACTYCHNPELMDSAAPAVLPWSEVRSFLERRGGLLGGVVFSGGEPTRQPALGPALREVREMGFATGLHTAGAYPRQLAAIIGAVDWVGLDIKALPSEYAAVTGVEASADKAFASLRVVIDSGVDHEIRVTVDPTTHTESGVHALVDLLASQGARSIVLQEARPVGARPAFAAALAGRRIDDVLPTPPPGATVRR